MPRKSINKSQPKDFEPRKKNPISLGDDSNLDNDLKPLLIGGEFSSLEVSNKAMRIIGDLDVESISASTLTTSQINQNSNYGILEFTTFGYPVFRFDSYSHTFSIISQFGSEPGYDLFSIDVDGNGSAYLETFDGADDEGKQAKMVFKSCNYLNIYTNKNGDYDDSTNYIGFNTGDGPAYHGKIDMNTASNFGIYSSSDYNLELKAQGTGDVILDSDDGNIIINDGGDKFAEIKCDTVGAGQSWIALKENAGGTDQFTIACTEHGATSISTKDFDASSADLTLDVDGDITLDAYGKQINFAFNGTNLVLFDMNAEEFRMMNSGNVNDYFNIIVGAEGATTISTVDADTTVGHLTLDADGIIKLDSAIADHRAGIQFLLDGTHVGDITGHHGATFLTIYENVGASTDDYVQIKCGTNGETTISTIDDGGEAGHLKLDAEGDITLDASTGNIYVKDNGGTYTPGSDYEIATKRYVDNASGGSVSEFYETKVCNYYTNSVNNQFIPLAGYVIERDTISAQNEYVSMVAPYNGTIERIVFRSEASQNGTLEFDIFESSDGTELPGTITGVKDTAINIADDTTVEVDFDSMTSGTNALVKGRIYAIQVDTPSAPYDTNITVVFKWDVTT